MPITLKHRETLMNAYEILKEQIEGEGHSVRWEVNFNTVKNEIEAAGKHVSPHFWPMYFDFNLDNGFCMVLERDGEGIAYICSQRIDCGGMNFHEKHLQRVQQCFGRDKNAKLDETWVCQPMLEYSGVGVYSGDAVTHPDWRSKGAKNLLSKISYMSQFLSAMHWPDIQWVGGLARGVDVTRGLAACYGARNMDPGAEHWITPPVDEDGNPARENGYWFLSSRRDDILYRAECIERGLLFGSLDTATYKSAPVAK